jgi:hypothetical protein
VKIQIDTHEFDTGEPVIERQMMKEVALELRAESRSILGDEESTDAEIALASRMASCARELDELRRTWWQPPIAVREKPELSHEAIVS